MGVTPALAAAVALGADGVVTLRGGGAPARRLLGVWLRDNCPCAECLHPASGQRIVDITTIPAGIRPASARLDGDRLEIEWPDGHRSSFPVDDLWAAPAADDLPARELWSAATPLPAAFDANRIGSNPAELRAWLDTVHRHGFALVRGVPARPGALEDLVALFGHVRETNYGRLFDVRTVTDPTNLAYTRLALGPHTDNPYRDPTPGVQLLHCIRADAGGGETTLVDGFAVAERLRGADPGAFELLHSTEVSFRYRGGGVDLRARFPVLRLDAAGAPAEVRWNTRSCAPFRFEPPLARAYYRAYREFGRLATATPLVRMLALGPGDAVIMDNLRVLHGRAAIVSPGQRHLQGCYADGDGLRSRLRTLRTNDEREGSP